MKTFYQFLEAIEKHKLEDKPKSSIRTILEQIEDKKDIVRFALYCAKDCFKFNNDVTRNNAINCINLVQRWLKDNNSVTDQQLKTTADTANITSLANQYHDDASDAANTAADAAIDAVYVASHTTDVVNYAVRVFYSAVESFFYAYGEDESIRQQKENEYKSYALSLLRSSNLMHKDENEDKEVEKQRNSFTNQFFSKKSKLTNRFNIMGLLDMLEEKGEDLVQHIGNELHLNIPNGITITAKDKNELVDKIWKNKFVLHYLEKLYR
jgi:hypothetical protein